jgi:hypothetical protein
MQKPSPVLISIFLVDTLNRFIPRAKRAVDSAFGRGEKRIKDMRAYLYARLLDGTEPLPWLDILNRPVAPHMSDREWEVFMADYMDVDSWKPLPKKQLVW